MKTTLKIYVDIPSQLHGEFKRSKIFNSCTTTSEAIRTAIRKVIDLEKSEKSSLKETTGNRANNGEYQNGQ